MKNKRIKQKAGNGTTLLIMVCLTLIMTELFFYAWCRIQCVKIGYTISSATEETKRLLSLRENLAVECERLKSPNRIVQMAKNKIGLITPKPEQIILIQ